jgi:hypothetical protein
VREYLYNNFTIGEATHFGSTIFVIRPSKYAHENWGDEQGNQFGELGQEFWFDASSLKEAENVIDGFVKRLENPYVIS